VSVPSKILTPSFFRRSTLGKQHYEQVLFPHSFFRVLPSRATNFMLFFTPPPPWDFLTQRDATVPSPFLTVHLDSVQRPTRRAAVLILRASSFSDSFPFHLYLTESLFVTRVILCYPPLFIRNCFNLLRARGHPPRFLIFGPLGPPVDGIPSHRE